MENYGQQDRKPSPVYSIDYGQQERSSRKSSSFERKWWGILSPC
jgi:hypothetical protein